MFIFRKHIYPQFSIVVILEACAFLLAPTLSKLALGSNVYVAPGFAFATKNLAASSLFAVVMMTGMLSMGLYAARQRARFDGIVIRILLACIGANVLLYLLSGIAMGDGSMRPHLAVAVLIGFCASVLIRAIMERVGDENIFKRRVLVYGAGARAESIAGLRRRTDQRGFLIVGYIPVGDVTSGISPDRLILAQEPLPTLCRRLAIDDLVIALEDRRKYFPAQELLECRLGGIDVLDLATFLERETGKVRLDVMRPSWMIFGDGCNRSALRRITERAFDFTASLILLAATWPLMLLIGLVIKLEDGWKAPIFYLQTRVGFENRVFRVIKFRSMRVDAETDGKPRWAAPDDPRITRVGAILRKVRLDELPQIFNVLAGEMRFVGPRPERPHFVDVLSKEVPYYRERHFVKPGITGWAQLCYNYGASHRDALEKLQYDLYYIKNQSLAFDLNILLQTVEVVCLGKGAR